MSCPKCSGEPTYLGALGALLWYRCRACGWEWSKTLTGREPAEPVLQQLPIRTETGRAIRQAFTQSKRKP